jgi:hypothetical protein
MNDNNNTCYHCTALKKEREREREQFKTRALQAHCSKFCSFVSERDSVNN